MIRKAPKAEPWILPELEEFAYMLSQYGGRDLGHFVAASTPRIMKGRAKYNGTFLRANLKRDVLEEVQDILGYCFLAYVRARRAGQADPVWLNEFLRLGVLASDIWGQICRSWPDFEGDTSNHLVEEAHARPQAPANGRYP